MPISAAGSSCVPGAPNPWSRTWWTRPARPPCSSPRTSGRTAAARDERVAGALAERDAELVPVGSPYAVPPGEVAKADGDPYKVFTPYARAWRAHGWPEPAPAPGDVRWSTGITTDGVPAPPAVAARLPAAGEAAASGRRAAFLDSRLDDYAEARDRPDLDATSRLSPYLKWGCIHPRQLLAELGGGEAHSRFRNELCWREFYADVLWHRPDTVHQAFRPEMRQMEVDTGPATHGRSGPGPRAARATRWSTPGMRQLAAEGWMHNRVRMIVASFLVKDLHLDWGRGARFFMEHLVDGDLASNHHGWQWVAGTGTDPSPYFRVFNPVSQGERYDPDGDYVRRWVPELRTVPGKAVHRPWALPGGPPAGYPEPIVDHADERVEALRRYAAVKG